MTLVLLRAEPEAAKIPVDGDMARAVVLVPSRLNRLSAALMAELLFETSTTDPVTFLTIPIVLALAAFLACCIPARRAARVDPLVALRWD